MALQRQLYRIGVARRGSVCRGEETSPCDVCDLTEKGVQLKTDLRVRVGDRLQLMCRLTDAVVFSCALQVTRISGPVVGTCIVEISAIDQERLSRFIEDVIALNLEGF